MDAPSAGSPAASAAPSSAAPAASAAAPAAPPAGERVAAKLHDTPVFTLRRGHGALTAGARARAASDALSRAVETPGAESVRVAPQGPVSVVYAGKLPVVDLYPEDAQDEGYSTVETYAAVVSSRVGAAIAAEKRRSAIAGTVFSVSLLVFFALVAVYVLRKVGDLVDSVRQWTLDNPDRITGLRVHSHEVIGPAALRGGLLVSLILGRVVAQLGVVYLWLVFALSLFEPTRPYTAKLTGAVVLPLSDFAGRVARSLPLAVVAAVCGVALYVLLRFVQLFFEGVARRQTRLPWLPPDLAAPTSLLVRVGVVVTALVFAAPIVTGDPEGSLARVGSIALLALGLATTPLLASAVVGTVFVYGRRVRVGQFAEVGGSTGRVRAVGLIDVRLVELDGTEVRVPHLLSLVRPTRVLGDRQRAVVALAVARSAPVRDVRRVLVEAASALGEPVSVELSDIDARAAHFTVGLTPKRDTSEGDVRLGLAEALAEAGHELAPAAAGASAR